MPITILTLQAQRPLLNHNTHNLKQHIRRGHSRQLGISIIRGRDLDDISSDDIHALESAQDGAEFAGGPAACFGGARCGSEGWVEGVDVDAEVDWLVGGFGLGVGVRGGGGGPDTVADTLDYSCCTDGVNLAGFDDLEAAVAVVVVVGGSREGSADPGVDVGVVC